MDKILLEILPLSFKSWTETFSLDLEGCVVSSNLLRGVGPVEHEEG